jgi:hypothetical protein
VYVSSHRLCATAGGRRFGDDSVTSIGRAEGAVASFRRDVENSFSCQNVYVVASTVSHVLELSAVLWVRVARIWVAPVEEILVKEGRWKLSKA